MRPSVALFKFVMPRPNNRLGGAEGKASYEMVRFIGKFNVPG